MFNEQVWQPATDVYRDVVLTVPAEALSRYGRKHATYGTI